MNSTEFLANPKFYFAGSFDQFCKFGGPCVHFHQECLRAGKEHFLSDWHIEMLYATLTAWGMHRMGDVDKTKTKLTNWDEFRESVRGSAESLKPFRGLKMLESTESEYAEAFSALQPCYRALRLSISGATVVVNSKALYHLLPDLIPPIDRQYTVRFFKQPLKEWRDAKGKFRTIVLPADPDAQFQLFHSICVDAKRLADRIDRALFNTELTLNGVTAPNRMLKNGS